MGMPNFTYTYVNNYVKTGHFKKGFLGYILR